MNIKEKINNPKLWQAITTILTAIIGYFGYEQVVQNQAQAPDVDVEVIVQEPIVHKHKKLKELAIEVRKNKKLIDDLKEWH